MIHFTGVATEPGEVSADAVLRLEPLRHGADTSVDGPMSNPLKPPITMPVRDCACRVGLSRRYACYDISLTSGKVRVVSGECRP